VTNWTAKETTTHQDHVIAHVVGATMLGYFVSDETAYLLLDIGFIWKIYLDGEMGLLPHPVALAELEADVPTKSSLSADIDSLLREGRSVGKLASMTIAPIECLIQSVDFLTRENSRRLVLTCDEGAIVIESSLDNCDFRIMSTNNDPVTEGNQETGLNDVVQTEQKFIRQKLSAELGREPTEEELNEWLREHTESY
jgi:hypothetical protein